MTITDTAPDLSVIGAEPPELAGIPAAEAPAGEKPKPPPRKSSRSGTSGAERRRRAAAGGDKPPAGASKKPSVEQQLREGFGSVAELLAFLDPFDAAWLEHNGPRVAQTLASSYPKVAELLLRVLSIFSGEAGGLVLLLAVAVPPLVHHGLIPERFAGYASMGTKLLGTEPPAKLIEKHSAARQQLAMAAAMMAAGAAGAGEQPAAPPAAA